MHWGNDSALEDSVRYRATLYKAFALGSDTFLVIVPGTRLRIELSCQMKEVLDSCNVADTIRGLVLRVQNKLKMSSRSVAEQVLRELIHQRLIVAEDRLVQKASESFQSTRVISTIAFPTADRAVQLRESLLSYARNARDHGREIEFIVMDSSNVATRESYVQSLSEIAHHCTIRYGGWTEKAKYVRLLIEEGIRPEVARFALLGEFDETTCRTGSNRNSILLDTVGRYIISVDDDTLCRLVVHPEHTKRLNLTDAGDPRDKWFYENPAHVRAEIHYEALDFVGHHEALLGSSLASLVSKTNEVIFDGVCDRILRASWNGRSCVAATMSGVAGDSGMYSALPLLRSTGETLSRLCSSEASLRCALRSRQVLSLVRGPTVVHRCPFMGYAIGLANVDTLPPFLPVGRNQDGVFGFLLGQSTPHLIGHVPLAVLHDNLARKDYESFPLCRIADLLPMLIMSLGGSYTRTEPVSLRFIGNALLEGGRLNDSDFLDWVSDTYTRQWAEHIRAMDRSLKMHPQYPIFWREEVLKTMEQSVVQLKDANSCIPVEFRDHLPLESAQRATKELVASFGALLYEWCNIVEAAERLQQRERRISVELSEA